MDKKLTKEQRKKISELQEYLSNNKRTNGNDIVDLYNDIFGRDSYGRKVPYTGCGSCLRRYLKIMVNALHKEEEENKARMQKAREAKAMKKETMNKEETNNE